MFSEELRSANTYMVLVEDSAKIVGLRILMEEPLWYPV
jgi:hypothetical protein